MANRGYDVVVDVDQEGDLGHTDLQEDLEFHRSDFDTPANARGAKIQPDTASFLPTHNSSGPAGSNSSSSRKHYLWTLSFYAQAFDVDTAEVLHRCRATLFPRANFLDVLEGHPDLYGPVWIATTVVVILFLTGTISQWMAQHNVEGGFKYDFKLLSEGAGLVYGYTAIVPVGLWAVLKWWGVESASLLEVVCLYGYANLVWIAVAVISWSPISILNYIFVALGFAASAFFLLRNLYPILSATDIKTSKILLIVVVALHAGLAITIKILFFATGSPVGQDTKGGDGGDKGGDGGDKKEGGERLVRMLFGM